MRKRAKVGVKRGIALATLMTTDIDLDLLRGAIDAGDPRSEQLLRIRLIREQIKNAVAQVTKPIAKRRRKP